MLSTKDIIDMALKKAENNELGIIIGSESKEMLLRDYSIISLDVETDNKKLGKISVVGPKRIDYSKIPAHLQHHKNKETFLNRFQVVDPYGCCHTVVAHIAMDGHYYIYPTLNPTIENVRSITIREAARLQSFPDDYFFEGSRSAAFKQIGNAVPVVLAHKIAEELKEQLANELQ